ncbi:hypothetical protein MVEN_02200500 [Mycena venus]|uniref:F-box domain-containing protein n=1 Tax=Mycena venus TaxID=2733690 RepID=A0A8H7CGG7_9AGAR|nr:hypothetical protein MVEN_02200500 [Mycena venus]
MEKLPYDLLELICSLLPRRDLLTLTQVSSHFRRSANFPLLSRFGISESDIDSGVISLSRAFFLIPFIERVRPIQKLICFQLGKGGEHGHNHLIDVLSSAAPIPDIFIHDQYSLSKNPARIARLLSRLPQTGNSTLLLVKHGSITVSRLRNVARLQWIWRPPHLNLLDSDSIITKLILVTAYIPLAAIFFLGALFHTGPLLSWIYRRLFGPALDQCSRIEEDIHPLYPGHWMRIDASVRIQTVAADFTLVTIAGELSRQMTISHMHGLGHDVYAAMLASLQLSEHLAHLTFKENSGLTLADAVAFIVRHQNLETIAFEPQSMRAVDEWPIRREEDGSQPYSSKKIRMVAAPSAYIPHILLMAPNLDCVSVSLVGFAANRTSSNIHDYNSALMAVAALPETHPIIFAVEVDGGYLPWDHGDKRVEAQLDRVKEVILRARRPLKLNGNEELIRWLGLFPALKRVTFQSRNDLVQRLPMDKKQGLAAAIRQECQNNSMDVVFGW